MTKYILVCFRTFIRKHHRNKKITQEKMLFGEVLSLSAFILMLKFSACESALFYPNNYERNVGEMCFLRNGEKGVCTEIIKCEHSKQLYQAKRTSEIVLCKFVGIRPYVCCPKPKITKFQKALCQDQSAPPLQLGYHISNGARSGVGDYPFQVALGYLNDQTDELEFNCGGSLIADDIVITAAHCVNRKSSLPIMARIGRTSLDLTDDDDGSDAQDIDIRVN